MLDENKVGLISLGCPKAPVDSERILTQLQRDGYSITPSYNDASIVVVNTCDFIDSGKRNLSLQLKKHSRRMAKLLSQDVSERKAIWLSSQDYKPGDLITIKVVKSDEYDLYGTDAF